MLEWCGRFVKSSIFVSAKYSDDAKDLKDRYMHLTNYSINKLSSQYTANEDANACQGHKW